MALTGPIWEQLDNSRYQLLTFSLRNGDSWSSPQPPPYMLLGWDTQAHFTLKDDGLCHLDEIYTARSKDIEIKSSFQKVFTVGVTTCSTAIIKRGNRIVFFHLDGDPFRGYFNDDGLWDKAKTYLSEVTGAIKVFISITTMSKADRKKVYDSLITKIKTIDNNAQILVFSRGTELLSCGHCEIGFYVTNGRIRIYGDILPFAFLLPKDLGITITLRELTAITLPFFNSPQTKCYSDFDFDFNDLSQNDLDGLLTSSITNTLVFLFYLSLKDSAKYNALFSCFDSQEPVIRECVQLLSSLSDFSTLFQQKIRDIFYSAKALVEFPN
jgi:hypothetical protein